MSANPLEELFISEFNLFNISCKQFDGQKSAHASVKQLLDKLKSLEAGALLSKMDVAKNLFEDVRSALNSFEKTDPKAFMEIWSPLLLRIENEQMRLSSTQFGSALPTPISSAMPVVPLSEEKTMVDFFLIELETRLEALNRGLLQLEQQALPASEVEELMRAAHAIKGGARLIGLDPIVQLTHAMEDGFVSIGKGTLAPQESQIEAYLHAIDLLSQLSILPSNQVQEWVNEQKSTVSRLVDELKTPNSLPVIYPEVAAAHSDSPTTFRRKSNKDGDRFLRVTARSLNRLIGLAGECLIQSRWLPPFGESLMKLKRKQDLLVSNLDSLKDSLQALSIDEKSQYYFKEVTRHADDLRSVLTDRLSDFETFGSRFSTLAKRLYQEVIGSRMRPFADGISAFPRFVRDMAKRLGKQVRLIVKGTEIQVDREILEKLESPLSHLLRNAVDHGIETPQERLALGKDPEGTIIIEAQHRAGALFITVSDDGRGCDLEQLRAAIVKKGLINEDIAVHLSEKELLDFLFLPGFSTAEEVTEISGRGVGLSVVQTMVQEVGGNVHVTSQARKGIIFSLQLPLTLSVVRALLVEIGGEIYALPVSRIHQLLFLQSADIGKIDQKLYFNLQGENIGLVSSHQILGLKMPEILASSLAVIVLYDQSRRYGIIVDQVVGEQELVVHELDPILGKVANVSAGAFMEDGAPLLILDVEDIMHSIEKLHQYGILPPLRDQEEEKKNILIVDDSATVREVESRLLRKAGYHVETAVDGMDAWNALKTMNVDLVITDLDMPRMNGLEFVRKLKNDPRFQALPVLIVSYKEHDSEKLKGFEAGADAYLTKGNFQDDALLIEVEKLLKKGTFKLTVEGGQ